MRHLLGLSGKDSLACALLLKAHKPEIWNKLEIFTTLTGFEYPETLKWLKEVESILKPITIIDGNLPLIMEKYKSQENYFLPSQQVRYCTRESKIKPFEKYIKGDKCLLYTGIRYDEQRIGFKSNSNIESVFPLHEFKFDIAKVYTLLAGLENSCRPPTFFWKELYQKTIREWDTANPLFKGFVQSGLSEIQKEILFSGRTRPNCFLCFNQRQYEVVWLCRTYPNLFEKMKQYESKEYTWIKDFPLSDLTEEKQEKIIKKRCSQLVVTIQKTSFSVQDDMFSGMTSCGLFCGK